jgi:hypothetical protein
MFAHSFLYCSFGERLGASPLARVSSSADDTAVYSRHIASGAFFSRFSSEVAFIVVWIESALLYMIPSRYFGVGKSLWPVMRGIDCTWC